MKKIVVVLFMLCVGFSCSDNVVPNVEDASVPASFSKKTSSFAFDFWKAFDKDAEGSYFLSPLSLNIALGMLLNGAEGETKQEIQNVLGFSDADLPQINATYQELISKLPKVDQKVTNTTANSVWYRNEFAIDPAFLGNLKTNFYAQAYPEDFNNPTTVDKVNQWAKDNTNGKIEKVIEEISSNTIMFLLNALYFKGDWTTQFNKEYTTKGEFRGEKTTAPTDFMNGKEKYKFAKTDGYRIVELPYGDKKYSFIAIMPEKGTVGNLVQSFDQEKWDAALASLKEQKVQVMLPKLKLESSEMLSATLNQMGIKKAFEPQGANLTGISKSGQLSVGFVKQDTYVALDEQGTEAAAVTSIGIVVTSVGENPEPFETFLADKPFIFAILEKTSNTIQFIGKVTDM